MHYKKYYDPRFVGSWDFEGKDEFSVTIKEIKVEELRTEDGTTANKPVLYFEKAKKGLCLNVTNAKIIAAKYGSDTEAWIGKKITLYKTTCKAFGKTVDCVRVQS